jgi:hypothetical protein
MSSSEGGSSSDDEADASCSRKFEISRIIETYLDPTSGNLSRQWTFVFDDGMFERQANFVTQLDLWRHLDRIDAGMTKLRMKAKKGTSRLYFAESAEAWAQQASVANKWIIRFSRKFPTDLANFWVKLVLSILSNRLPDASLVLGCSFTTKKGKSEMDVYLLEPPDGIEPENDHLMRECLGVDKREKTIQFSFKSYRAQLQQEADEARVNQVKQKKAHTWPLVANNNVYDPEEELATCKKQMLEEPATFEPPLQPFRYVFETSSSSLSLPSAASRCSSVPSLSLEELQELQLQQLKLCASDTDDKPAKEESEEDVMPEIGKSNEVIKQLEPKEEILRTPAVPIVSRSFPFTKDECDAEFERRMLYDSPEDETLLESPHKINPKNCSPPEFVLGTNPPDFSSPLMRVAMSKHTRRAFHRKLSL